MWQTWRAITCKVCRDLHLKLLFSGLLQKGLFKGRWSLMERHNYNHACHGCNKNICRLLSSVINRDNGIQISGAYVPTIYPVPGDHRGRVAKNGEQRDISLRRSHHLDAWNRLPIIRSQSSRSGLLKIQLSGRKVRLEGQLSWVRTEKHQPLATIPPPC